MRKLQAFLLICIGYLFTAIPSFATHLIGGDLIYTCLGNNRYRLEFTLYQDCTNPALTGTAINADNPLQWAIYKGNAYEDPLGARFHTSGSINQIEYGIVPVEFSNDCITNIPNVCMRFARFVTEVTLPASNEGYTILYQRCCRNQTILNLIDPGNTGMTMYNYIPPFANNVCANNSPRFRNVPPQIVCANNAFRYDFSATDADGDSLVYKLCEAYPGGSPGNAIPSGTGIVPPDDPVFYRPPLSASNPINSFPPFAIDARTGIMTGTPTTTGRYIVTVCVDEYKNGRYINTISRDVQFTITDCSKAVVADLPDYPGYDGVIDIQCNSYTVDFKHNSKGGFTYKWDFGDGRTSTDSTPSHTYSDTGIYTVKLVVNPGTTCTDSIVKEVYIYPYFSSEIIWNGNLCPTDTIYFEENSQKSFGDVTKRIWEFQDTIIENTVKVAKRFSGNGGPQVVRLYTENELGCRDTVEVVVPIDYVNVSAGNDTAIVLGYDYNLNGSGAVNYQWLQPHWVAESTNPKSKVNFTEVGVYDLVLRGITQNGCEDYDTVRITVVENPQLFLPNAFSPNGDGLNDVFKPNMVGFSTIKFFEVFDRFGELVYKSTNNNAAGWDGTFKGKPCDVGVYYYRVVAEAPEGKEDIQITGDVTLLR